MTDEALLDLCGDNAEDLVYWNYVVPGILEVRADGTVWRVMRWHARPPWQRRQGESAGEWVPCEPRRADTKESNRRAANRYKRVEVRFQGRMMSCMAHRLVWRALVGPVPPGLEINHKDRCRWHNHPSNLEVLGRYDNTMDAHENGDCGRDELGRFQSREQYGHLVEGEDA